MQLSQAVFRTPLLALDGASHPASSWTMIFRSSKASPALEYHLSTLRTLTSRPHSSEGGWSRASPKGSPHSQTLSHEAQGLFLLDPYAPKTGVAPWCFPGCESLPSTTCLKVTDLLKSATLSQLPNSLYSIDSKKHFFPQANLGKGKKFLPGPYKE